jgi:hypothetical protein
MPPWDWNLGPFCIGNNCGTSGEKEAGDYASWAEMKLRQEEFTADSMVLEDGLFHLGAIRTKGEENFPGGERVTVEIPIGSTGNESVDPSALEVYVFFFEMTDNGKIEQTSSQDIHYQWLGQPTWANGPERLEVIYTRMDGNAEEIRKFYGYIVRIYYRSRLQDVTARPRTLMDYRASSIEWDQPEDPVRDFYARTGSSLVPPIIFPFHDCLPHRPVFCRTTRRQGII